MGNINIAEITAPENDASVIQYENIADEENVLLSSIYI